MGGEAPGPCSCCLLLHSAINMTPLLTWQVPWGQQETALGFVGWILTFLLTSLITIPSLVQLTGTSIQVSLRGSLCTSQRAEKGFLHPACISLCLTLMCS